MWNRELISVFPFKIAYVKDPYKLILKENHLKFNSTYYQLKSGRLSTLLNILAAKALNTLTSLKFI